MTKEQKKITIYYYPDEDDNYDEIKNYADKNQYTMSRATKNLVKIGLLAVSQGFELKQVLIKEKDV